MSIFKSCDIRGVYGDELTDGIMADVGRAIAAIVRRKIDRPRIVVGGDVRRSTESLKRALVDAMVESGADVIDAGVVPTPVFYYAFHALEGDAGAMVTASHNPPKFNGLKMCFSDEPVSENEIAEVRRVVAAREFVAGSGSLQEADMVAGYEQWLGGQFPDRQPMKIAVDAGGGTWAAVAPGMLTRLGFEVVAVNCATDPDLSRRNPNPLPQHLGDLCEAVADHGCAFGAAFDADGDRVVFVDETGTAVPGDMGGAVLAAWMLEENPRDKIVYEVNCTQALADAVRQAGGVPLMERAGHAFMKRRMLDEDALFGAEISGHYYFRSIGGGDDGMFALMMLARMLQQGEALSALANAIPHYYSTSVVRLPRNHTDAARIVEAIADNAMDAETTRIDGIRAQYPEGWALARVSVTEPVISLRFEATERELLPSIIERFLGFDPALMQEVIDFLREHDQI